MHCRGGFFIVNKGDDLDLVDFQPITDANDRFLEGSFSTKRPHAQRRTRVTQTCHRCRLRRWLEDLKVWITGPHEEVVQSAEVERIYRDRYLAHKSDHIRIG